MSCFNFYDFIHEQGYEKQEFSSEDINHLLKKIEDF